MSGKSGVSITTGCKMEIKAAVEKRKDRLRKLAINVVIGRLSDGELCLKIIGVHFTHLPQFPCGLICAKLSSSKYIYLTERNIFIFAVPTYSFKYISILLFF